MKSFFSFDLWMMFDNLLSMKRCKLHQLMEIIFKKAKNWISASNKLLKWFVNHQRPFWSRNHNWNWMKLFFSFDLWTMFDNLLSMKRCKLHHLIEINLKKAAKNSISVSNKLFKWFVNHQRPFKHEIVL